MTSLLTKSALDKLPADIRDHIQVVSETGYGITLAMTIGDLERLTGHFNTLNDLRAQAEAADEFHRLYHEAVDEKHDAEAELDDAYAAIDKALVRLRTILSIWEDTGVHPSMDTLRTVAEVLEK